jgi:hypothetical protein
MVGKTLEGEESVPDVGDAEDYYKDGEQPNYFNF